MDLSSLLCMTFVVFSILSVLVFYCSCVITYLSNIFHLLVVKTHRYYDERGPANTFEFVSTATKQRHQDCKQLL